VTLSACDTGSGEAVSGDGVYGMRRALYLAGSDTQVLSLWQVDDEATSQLMIRFYGELQQGTSRGEALRRAKAELLASERFAHPYFWAAFILNGSPNKLDGSPPEPVLALGSVPRLPRAARSPRGCGCGADPALGRGGGTGVWLLCAASALALRRRRGRPAAVEGQRSTVRGR
jgi:hypothetical protein